MGNSIRAARQVSAAVPGRLGAIIEGFGLRSWVAGWRFAAIGAAVCLGGCTTQIAGVLPLFDSLTVVSWVSTAVSGKSLSEYALDAFTGKDCRFLDGVLRADRRICEERGATSTGGDFRGLAGLFDRDKLEPDQPTATLVAAAVPADTQPAAPLLVTAPLR